MISMDEMENKLVVQSNTLIEASYKLRPNQQKFLRVMAAMICKDDQDFKMYEFRIGTLLDLFGIKDQTKYSEIPRQTRELMGNVLTFKSAKKIIQVPFLNYCEHELGTGIVRVQFHPFLKPFYLSLGKDNPYTKYALNNILRLRSVYSIRLFELLKQYQAIGHRLIEIDKLREIFQITTEYKKYNDFKRFVLEHAKEELEEKTDISFDFEEIKTGRKVTSIRFYIKSKSLTKTKKTRDEIAATKSEDPDANTEKKELIKQVINIISESITELEAIKILHASNWNTLVIQEKYKIAKQTNGIKNVVAWLIKAIKENYSAPISGTNNNSFTNRKQASFDVKALEESIRNQYSNPYEEHEDITIDEILGRNKKGTE